jgi:hypothetical protein
MVSDETKEPQISYVKGNLRKVDHEWILNDKYKLQFTFSVETLRDNKIAIQEADDVLVYGIVYDTQILVYSLKINGKLYQILDKDGKSKLNFEIKTKK